MTPDLRMDQIWLWLPRVAPVEIGHRGECYGRTWEVTHADIFGYYRHVVGADARRVVDTILPANRGVVRLSPSRDGDVA